MKFKIMLATLLAFCVSAAVCADSDAFYRRLKICNSYKTTFKDSQGRVMKKGVMGAIYKSVAEAPYCYYYIQKSPDNYSLCYISVNDLKDEPLNLSKAVCGSTSEKGIKQTYREIGSSNYVLQRAIIKSTDF